MDRQTPRDGIGRAYAQRRAAKIDKYRNENSANYKCHLRSHSYKNDTTTIQTGYDFADTLYNTLERPRDASCH